jgi:hypothetical protein
MRSVESFTLRRYRRFWVFPATIGGASMLILERCAFRVAELSEGFGGRLANAEALFMVLDGVAMVVVVILLTGLHPGWVIGENLWGEGRFWKGRCCGGRRRDRKNNARKKGTVWNDGGDEDCGEGGGREWKRRGHDRVGGRGWRAGDGGAPAPVLFISDCCVMPLKGRYNLKRIGIWFLISACTSSQLCFNEVAG